LTAYQTIPVIAINAIPNKFLTENNIRVYGFHGTSHKYVSERAREYLDKSDKYNSLRERLQHDRIKDGISIDHSRVFF
jgi:acetate kinase